MKNYRITVNGVAYDVAVEERSKCSAGKYTSSRSGSS